MTSDSVIRFGRVVSYRHGWGFVADDDSPNCANYFVHQREYRSLVVCEGTIRFTQWEYVNVRVGDRVVFRVTRTPKGLAAGPWALESEWDKLQARVQRSENE